MNVKVSILLATYNGARFLPELLSSLTQQTYPALEIVCCDDSSIDGTVDLLRNFAATSRVPVRVHVNSQNKGYRRNFLEGIALCRGDFVALCDQDDVWKPEKLERLVGCVGPDLRPSMVFSDVELVNEQLSPLGKTAIQFSGIGAAERRAICNGDLLRILLKRPLIPGMAMMVNRNRAILNLPTDQSLMHDYSLSAAFALGGDYAFVDQCLVYYRQHPQNAVGMANSPRRKKRRSLPTLCAANYREEANADLRRTLSLYSYAAGVKSLPSKWLDQHTAMINWALQLNAVRLKRRSSWCGLVTRHRLPYNEHLTLGEKRRMWFKDLRIYLRLKVNSWICRSPVTGESNIRQSDL